MSYMSVSRPLILRELVEVGVDDVVDQPPQTKTLVPKKEDHE